MTDTSVLTQSSIDYIRSTGDIVIINPDTINLTRRSLRSSSSGQGSSPRILESEYNRARIDIPKIVESVEAFSFCGFQEVKAQKILVKYLERVEVDGGYLRWPISGLAGFLRDEIRYWPIDAFSSDSDAQWDAILDQIGMNMRTRQGILDPDYKDVRARHSAKEWAMITVSQNLEFLESCDRLVKDKRAWDTSDSGTSGNPSDSSGSSPWVDGRPSFPADNQPRPQAASSSRTGTLQHRSASGRAERVSTSDPQYAPDVEVLSQQAKEKEGETALFMGGTTHQFLAAVDCDWVVEHKSLRLSLLESRMGGDFHRCEACLYFTTQKDTARKYAGFAARRCNTNVACSVMQINVPSDLLVNFHDFMSSATATEEQWQQWVWGSRNRYTVPNMLALQSQNISLFIGPILNCSTEEMNEKLSFRSLKPWLISPDLAPDYSFNWASQYAFIGKEIQEELSKRCLNKVTIHDFDIPDT